jgi:hypothetical protein
VKVTCVQHLKHHSVNEYEILIASKGFVSAAPD